MEKVGKVTKTLFLLSGSVVRFSQYTWHWFIFSSCVNLRAPKHVVYVCCFFSIIDK